VYLLGKPTEIAKAVWADLTSEEVSKLVDATLTEVDADGHPRFFCHADGTFEPNPAFTRPG
jgi:hypothetical protein